MIVDALAHCATFVQDVTYPLRAMLYLLAPSETYFELEEQVPHLPVKSMILFTWFIIMENAVVLVKHGRLAGTVSDTLTSVGAGLLSLIPK
jgi:hypothetical protein